ncbi:hypothetical protein MARA_00200 (plasmid) [Mycolicibacterium arabiense]|uniref:Uncharacterized protein n=2 Tax=Mycolicibacterium arabiense TaxID=1286181 RepID=A0A7I7RQL5_9MYCO|nr:hypothetical protein MARA_00200 [Mycolicibacterium arabiense]
MVLDQILIPYDQPMSVVRMLAEAGKPFPHPQAVHVAAQMLVRPLIAAWEANPPEEGSDLWKWIFPARAAATNMDPRSTNTNQFVTYIELARKARELLATGGGEPLSLDSLLNDLTLDVKLAVLVARLGHNGILQLIDRRISAAARAATRQEAEPGPHLDLLTLEATEAPSYRTMSYSDIRAMADPGVATIEEYLHGDPKAEQAPILKYFAAQWVTHITTLWDEHYRPALAELHRCEKNDIGSELFADLNKMRQDYVHNQGIASSRQSKNKRLNWFEEGDQMIPTSEDYEKLFAEVRAELEFLRKAPTPKTTPNRTAIKGTVPVDLRSMFKTTAAAAGLGANAALEEAVQLWISSKQAD